MWHVNTAELIVTTWGSAMATVTNLLMPRRRHHVGPNHSSRSTTSLDDAETQRTPPQHQQQRILVLVHPSYCHEVFVLNMPYKQCFKLTRSPAKTFAQTISIVRRRAPTDFLGGPDFCIKYLLVSSLRYVVDRDLLFSCPRR
ncbi:Hypothetical protein, putative [Bodo saltans]|uniref:Uncharacterized protein n=1 Tax=Bodo saltans TaxID=75058 RepID=A0A0S4JB62_BODSA|nr:Hypothetical protein, putative [Bodo saltans]|eukprot:CUG87445.1 Hypothetical protein, putative [Bodo saltans]